MGDMPARVFVGRERELGVLRTAIEGASAGRAGLFLVSGEPGIGKTRLCEEVAALACDAGGRVLIGRCVDADGVPVLWPWGGVLSEPLGAVTPETIAAFLRANARTAPLLLVLDDLHAAAVSSLRVLHALADSLQNAPIIIVGTYRDAEVRRRPALTRWLDGVARAAQIVSLAGLFESDVTRFVAAATGVVPAPALVRALYRRTAGNPLYLDALLRLPAAAAGLVRMDAGALAGLVPDLATQASVRRRIETFGRDCAELLDAAAVIGEEFDLPTLRHVWGDRSEDVAMVLDEARTTGLVRAVVERPDRYAFTPPLIRDAVYAGLPPERRLSLHRAVDAARRTAAGPRS